MQPLPEHDSTPKRGPHRWVKGESGNPLGKPRHVLPDGRTVREAARDATPAALAFLLQCVNDPDEPKPIRIAAATAILRTGHADAPKTPEADTAGLTVKVVNLVHESPPGGVRGVLNSPVRSDIYLPSAPASEVLS